MLEYQSKQDNICKLKNNQESNIQNFFGKIAKYHSFFNYQSHKCTKVRLSVRNEKVRFPLKMFIFVGE
jgi:hypothetical protein